MLVLTDRGEALAVGHPELEGLGRTGAGELLTDRLVDDPLDHLLGDRRRLGGRVGTRVLLLRGRQGLGDLAVVAVDGDGLETELPRQQVQGLDVLDAGLLGHVDRLGDRTRQERLHRTHHPDVALVVDGVVTHRAGEHRHVGSREMRSAEDRLVLVDVGDDVVDLVGGVAEATQGPRDRLIDDRHRATTDELLQLDEAEVGFDAGRVAVHHQADRAGRGQNRGLRVAHAVHLAVANRRLP